MKPVEKNFLYSFLFFRFFQKDDLSPSTRGKKLLRSFAWMSLVRNFCLLLLCRYTNRMSSVKLQSQNILVCARFEFFCFTQKQKGSKSTCCYFINILNHFIFPLNGGYLIFGSNQYGVFITGLACVNTSNEYFP